MEPRKMNWTSTCPVTRQPHNWYKIGTFGNPNQTAYCNDCRAEWVGVEREWDLYERNIKEYYYSEQLGGWALFDKVQGF